MNSNILSTIKKFPMERLILLVGGILIAILGLFNISHLYGIAIIDDEFGYWATAAQIAGKDWTELLVHTGFYSYGYGLLLVPLFFTGLSPTGMYQTAVGMNVVFLIAAFLLTYWVARQVFPERDKRLLSFISLVVTLYCNNIFQMHVAWTETVLYLLFWCVIGLICRIQQKNRAVDYILLAVTTIYLYAIHNRTIGLLALVLIYLLVSYRLARGDKKLRRKILAGLICMAALFVLASEFRQYVVETWYASNNHLSNNDYSGNVGKVKNFFDLQGLVNIFISFMGKLFYLSTSTFLLVLLPLFAVAFHTVKSIWDRLVHKKNILWSFRERILFMGVAAFFVEFGVSVVYLGKAVDQIRLVDLLYGRYAEFAAGPMILFGICMLAEQRRYWKELICGLMIYIVSAVVVLLQLPHLGSNYYSSFNLVGVYRFFEHASGYSQAVYIMIAVGLLGFFLTAGSSVLWKIKSDRAWASVFYMTVGLAGVYWCVLGIAVSTDWGYSRWDTADVIMETTGMMRQLGEEARVYYVAVDEDYPYSFAKIFQFLDPDREIHMIGLEDLEETYEGNYIYMSGMVGELIEKLNTDKRMVHFTGGLSLFVDEGSIASDILWIY